MSTELSDEATTTLKDRFRAIGCRVNDIEGANFEAIGDRDFPLSTIVSANPYFVEFNTFVTAVGLGFLKNRLSNVHALLNSMNREAKIAKLTLDADRPDAEAGGWFIEGKARLLTGVLGYELTTEALGDFFDLWRQDFASLKLAQSSFEVRLILKPEGRLSEL